LSWHHARVRGRPRWNERLQDSWPRPSADLQLRAARVEFEDTQGGLSIALDGLEAEGLKLRPAEGGDGSRQIEGRLSVAASRVGQADTVLNLSALPVDQSRVMICALSQADANAFSSHDAEVRQSFAT
jgi:hypothetical protein